MNPLFFLSVLIQISLSVPSVSYGGGYGKFYELGIQRYQAGEYDKAAQNFEAAKISSSNKDLIIEAQKFIVKCSDCKKYNELAKEAYQDDDFFTAKYYYQKLFELNPSEKVNLRIRICEEKYNPNEEMVDIYPGEYTMGTDKELHVDNNGEHDVYIGGFFMDKYEVQNIEYARYLNLAKPADVRYYIDIDATHCKIGLNMNGEYYVKEGYEYHPVAFVSWYGADAYAKFYGKRLPTEAEWEYAARGGNESKDYTYSGSDDISYVANYSRRNLGESVPVGSYVPNELGLYDMTGNVWEWCSDYYSETSYITSRYENPEFVSDTDLKVIRGGGFTAKPDKCEPTFRSYDIPETMHKAYGFRCVRDIK